MAGFSGASGVPKKYVDDLVAQSTAMKTMTVSHGTIDAGTSSTVETPNITKNRLVVGISISGSYNSECVVWGYYMSGTTFVSRVRNVGTHQAQTITVTYLYID